MRSTFHAIETAKRSLYTQQAALNTTGHNVANANTPGFSRQVVNMAATKPLEAIGMSRSTAPGQLGTGVYFSSITRVREQFLDQQFRDQNKMLGSWQIRADSLEKLETIFNEPSDTGIRTVLDNFWKAWSSLSQDPENVTSRKVVKENAIALTDTFNQMSKQLTDMRDDLTANINVKASEINTTLSTISNLNSEIKRIESLGDDANDLRDQRDLLTDKLSNIVSIRVTETSDGYQISMGNQALIDGPNVTQVTPDLLKDAYDAGDLSSGEVHGMILSRDTYVEDYLNQLNALANTIANGEIEITIPAGSVLPEGTVLGNPPVTYSGANRTLKDDIKVTVAGLNGLHQLGYTFDSPSSQGVPFFTSKDGGPITAGSIDLNAIIKNDATKIATSMRTAGTGTSETTVKGNNTLAMLVSHLKDTAFKFNNPSSSGVKEGTLDDYFRATVGQLGVQSAEAGRQTKNLQTLVDYVDSRRESVSGVSMDEEMSNMIKFQHAYSAAARFMTTIDQVLDKLINSTGVVGR
ncbi:flagellar hook-associated protein FlgK [Paenibacillus albiflavus]|uniref:Flagellar hook-associated protein 1 n=1 Tax=Paenibacillus albiflavus TaxID=2545760 RepID=A0A4R4EF74_9BACL|nr:flagellar hook-associated protein FlgK [Paenibacillus albiflavus]TCZ76841.1 flagellar hook-associated protein FlgK [Paenibacillus albiflavus]